MMTPPPPMFTQPLLKPKDNPAAQCVRALPALLPPND
jgi:hypothetical protein